MATTLIFKLKTVLGVIKLRTADDSYTQSGCRWSAIGGVRGGRRVGEKGNQYRILRYRWHPGRRLYRWFEIHHIVSISDVHKGERVDGAIEWACDGVRWYHSICCCRWHLDRRFHRWFEIHNIVDITCLMVIPCLHLCQHRACIVHGGGCGQSIGFYFGSG